MIFDPSSHPIKIVQLNFGLIDKGVLEHDLLDEVVPGEASQPLLHLLSYLRLDGVHSLKGFPASVLEQVPPRGQ